MCRSLESPVYICAEVDDLVITGGNERKIQEVRDKLDATFGATQKCSWEPITSFLGIDIEHDVENQECTFGVPYKIQKLFDDHGLLHLGSGKKTITPSEAAEDRLPQDPRIQDTFSQFNCTKVEFQETFGHTCLASCSSADYEVTKHENSHLWSKSRCEYALRSDGAAFKSADDSYIKADAATDEPEPTKRPERPRTTSLVAEVDFVHLDLDELE